MSMRRFLIVALTRTLLGVFFFGFAGSASAQILEGRILDVLDGDTVVVQTSGRRETVRYLLIDTPETHHPHRPLEEFGNDAHEKNKSLVLGRRIFLELDGQHRDRYNRLLAHVWVDLGSGDAQRILASEWLARQGLCLPMIIPPNTRYVDKILEATREAATQKRGIWQFQAKRLFTPRQVWNELPQLAGNFVTVRTRIVEVKESAKRFLLYGDSPSFCGVVYKPIPQGLPHPSEFVGKVATLFGKIQAGFGGAELLLSAPEQLCLEPPR